MALACASSPPDPSPAGGVSIRSRFLAGRGSLEILAPAGRAPALRRDGDRLVVTLHGVVPEEAVRGKALANPFVASLAIEPVRGGSAIAIVLTEPDRTETSARTLEGAGGHRLLIAFADVATATGREDRIRAAFAGIGPEALSPCELVSERMLRAQIGAPHLTRALTPDGGPYDALVTGGLDRLAELSPFGTLHLEGPGGGEAIPLADPETTRRARARAGEVRGLVLLLRVGIERLEPDGLGDAALRGLLAPDLSADRFGTVLRNADDAAGLCARSAGSQAGSEKTR